MDVTEASFQGDENKRAEFYEMHRKVQEFTQRQQHLHKRDFELFRIPVVFHILQNENVPVITEAQIVQELAWLNDWFSALNNHYDMRGTYWEDDIAVGSEFGITFEFAAFDPNGSPTNGIIFHQNSPVADDCYDNYYLPEEGGISLWNTLEYYNVIICRAEGVLGFSYIPGPEPYPYDGTVLAIDEQIGNPFYSGSTISHETGHWFGLFHTFDGCGEGDYVDDTPATETPSFDLYEEPFCPAEGGTDTDYISECPGVGPYMTQNVMDYNVEPCMSYFSKGQVARMRSFLMDGVRSQLTFSPGLSRCPTYDCTGKTCGPDGCGRTCGRCFGDDTCESNGLCSHIPLVNEVCTGAIEISVVRNSTSFENVFVSPLAVPQLPGAEPCQSLAFPLWYKFTASSDEGITISTAGSSFNTILNVYSSGGNCNSLSCTESHGNSISQSTAKISFCPEIGVTYYIVAGGSTPDDFGQLTISLASVPNPDPNGPCLFIPLANEYCTGAVEIPYVFDSTSFEYVVVSPFANPDFASPPPCLSLKYPLWYKFTASFVSQTVVSTMGSDFDTILNVFQNSCSSLLCVDSNDDARGLTSQVTFCPTLGTTYFIVAGGFRENSYGNLTISLTSESNNLCCVPNCAGKQCGSDGCGRSCPNLCNSEQQCVNSVCVGPPTATATSTSTSTASATSAPVPSSSPQPTRTSVSVSAEIVISLQSTNFTGSRQSAIENAIDSELNQGADVTVTALDSSQATVLVCDTTDQDLDKLLLAFEDGSFTGTILDGARVDSVKMNVECDISSDSSSSNVRTTDVSEGSFNQPSTLLSIFLSLAIMFYLF